MNEMIKMAEPWVIPISRTYLKTQFILLINAYITIDYMCSLLMSFSFTGSLSQLIFCLFFKFWLKKNLVLVSLLPIDGNLIIRISDQLLTIESYFGVAIVFWLNKIWQHFIPRPAIGPILRPGVIVSSIASYIQHVIEYWWPPEYSTPRPTTSLLRKHKLESLFNWKVIKRIFKK